MGEMEETRTIMEVTSSLDHEGDVVAGKAKSSFLLQEITKREVLIKEKERLLDSFKKKVEDEKFDREQFRKAFWAEEEKNREIMAERVNLRQKLSEAQDEKGALQIRIDTSLKWLLEFNWPEDPEQAKEEAKALFQKVSALLSEVATKEE